MLSILNYDGTYIEISPAIIWSVFAVIMAIVIAFYLLRSFGVYKVSKRQQLKCLWLAFIPVGWLLLFTKVAGDIVFFGKRIKNSDTLTPFEEACCDLVETFDKAVIHHIRRKDSITSSLEGNVKSAIIKLKSVL